MSENKTEKRERTVFLQGKQVYLRPQELADQHRCMRWINNPEVRRYLARSFPLGETEEKEWLEQSTAGNRENIQLAIVLNDNDKHVGNIGLHRIEWHNQHATFGIAIGETGEHKKGIGYEAGLLILEYGFNTLNLRRVSSHVIALNQASLALHRKLRFKEEGIRREKWFIQGEWVDEVAFGMLRDEVMIR